jgi:hypothetical protein
VVLGATWYLATIIGAIQTEITIIRTNDLRHLDERLFRVETIFMGGTKSNDPR